jgi:ParB family transcriptional regulator, chromosome partitioning protein
LTVRTIEELVREHNGGGEADGPGAVPEGPIQEIPDGGEAHAPSAPRRLPPPGILELEELLSSHLNTRVKVDLTSKHGKVVVEFATLEDLERIYKLMVGRSESAAV